ncbi:hypothetical protein Kpol_359p11 [Vanderwaltozyma polyspora DSM 70294]|uniref:Flavin reductase like domain-containing protein n=1 Tax=Vanderwaltozyma polyspora (strain ATCC 22028 / DSM 70294 / BCRC 21397 / CBS 2163 / NBRC 10782 / NRRL Y-8283 / UCD 57-17) TaxID=436907 RepID=A7TSB3_VANPO|nr:uncharacterized protein Kpol_359p11 [Vanderwaltozyma polyspora DSM 70294]EDO14850.1 hypothetical protein Kpol_359p11 [Vanderwaltozyma polyspora DSM 70294]
MSLLTKRWSSSTHSGKHLVKQQLFKDAMGKMASQAMIISSACNDNLPHSSFRGLTASSVSSLALKPSPMIQFNIQLPSFTSDFLHKYSMFAVHLLKPNPVSIELAKTFSQGATTLKHSNVVVPTKPFATLKEDIDYETLSIRGTDLVIPILKNSEYVLLCKKKDVFRVGDHEIWVGNVEDILVNDQDSTGGVLYYNRNFHKLGGVIPHNEIKN